MITQMPMQGVGSLAGMQAGEPAEDIACELLDGLNSLPVECVSHNRQRVREREADECRWLRMVLL